MKEQSRDLMKAIKWIFLAILIGLVAAGSLIAWASPPEAADEESTTSPQTTGSYLKGEGAAAASVARGPNSQAISGMRLIGTAVVDGATSIAFLQLISGTRFVREGEEIVDGIRLVRVWRNRIGVERGGRHQEIRSDSNEGIGNHAPPYPNSGEIAPDDVDRLRETQGRMGRSLFYSHYRKLQNQ